MLTLATESEKAERDRVTYPAWGPPLSVDGFLVRELALRSHRFCRDGMQTWLWRGAGGEVLASCETFRVESRWRGQRGHTYEVASVFTEERLRGQGHAGAMMSALVEHLPRIDPLAQASVLFSDVGAELYRRAGYREPAAPPRDYVLAPQEGRCEVEWLSEHQLPASLEPAGELSVLVGRAQLDWQLERERIYAGQQRRARPMYAGARADGALALWAANFRYDELAVLWLEASAVGVAEKVLRASQLVAARAGLPRVRLWDPGLRAALPTWVGASEVREGSLPMLAPLAPGPSIEAWVDVPRALWV